MLSSLLFKFICSCLPANSVPVRTYAILAVVPASSAIVKAVDPVTSTVCVALLVLAVFAAIAALIELANLASVTASSAIFAVVTPPSASAPVIYNTDHSCMTGTLIV